MNRIDDPRLVFYLKHQGLIDEWAAVQDDVRHAAIDFYESLAGDLEAVAASLDGDVVVVRKEAGYGYVGLANRIWLKEDTARVGVVLEWQRSSASFTGGNRFAGVRVDLDDPGGRDLSSVIRDRVRAKREAARYPSSSQTWPAYTAVSGADDPEYWRDLEPFRRNLVELVRNAWDAFAVDIDEAVRATAQISSPEADTLE